MYTVENFKTKKALKEAVKAGKEVRVYSPGPYGNEKTDGNVALEGPHYPAPHSWYASATLNHGLVVAVR